MAVELSLAIGLDESLTVRVLRGSGGSILIEIPKPNRYWYDVPIDKLPKSIDERIVLGVKRNGIASINFAYPLTAHLLVAGYRGKVDLIYIEQKEQSDGFISPFNDQERGLHEQDERGTILYLTNNSI